MKRVQLNFTFTFFFSVCTLVCCAVNYIRQQKVVNNTAVLEMLLNASLTLLLVDIFCWDLPGHIALDKAPLDVAPLTHTVHCMRDVQVCRDGGFGLLELREGSATEYEVAYVFDAEGNRAALELLDATDATCGLSVTATGSVVAGATTLPRLLAHATLIDAGGTECGALPPKLLAHAICMGLGWGIFLPLGILVAAVGKRGPCSTCAPWWFKVHIVLNSIGLLCIGVGFVLITMHVVDGAHFTIPHHIIGGIACTIAFLQPLNAVCRNHAPKGKTSWLQLKSILVLAADGEEEEGGGEEMAGVGAEKDTDALVDGRGAAITRVSRVSSVLYRLGWELWHKGLGYLALSLATINLFIGLSLVRKTQRPGSAAYTWNTLIGVALGLAVALWIVVFVVKSVLNLTLWRIWPAPSAESTWLQGRARFCGVCCTDDYQCVRAAAAAGDEDEGDASVDGGARREEAEGRGGGVS